MVWGGAGWGGLNPNLVSALAPFGLVRAGAEIGAELDNKATASNPISIMSWPLTLPSLTN